MSAPLTSREDALARYGEPKICPCCRSKDVRYSTKTNRENSFFRETVWCGRCGIRTDEGKKPGAALWRWNTRNLSPAEAAAIDPFNPNHAEAQS